VSGSPVSAEPPFSARERTPPRYRGTTTEAFAYLKVPKGCDYAAPRITRTRARTSAHRPIDRSCEATPAGLPRRPRS